jgi:hypothetical protein
MSPFERAGKGRGILGYIMSKVRYYSLDGHLSRDFACLAAAHAIGDEVEIRIGSKRIEILIVASYTADVGESEGLQHKGRCQPAGVIFPFGRFFAANSNVF